MKKWLIALVIGAALLAPSLGAASPAASVPMDMLTLKVGKTTALVNGQPVVIEVGPFVKNGRTLVPFRFLGEALGARVRWERSTETAILTTPELTIRMPAGGNPTVNGKRVTLDVPAEIRNGRLSVPLRFVSEQLGCFVQYDAGSQVILIRKADITDWRTYTALNNLSYRVPAAYTVGPDFENENIVSVTTPNGSTLKTYFVNQRPESLQAFFEQQFVDSGWTLQRTYLEGSQDPRLGYEMRFVRTAANGEKVYLEVFVDPLGEGSNVGEVTCSEALSLTEGFLLYRVMSS